MEKQFCYDKELNIEVYSFKNVQQEFPNHFHNYYVIGFVESGKRLLNCKNKKCILNAGHVLLLNPNDNHGCTQAEQEPFNYIAINFSVSAMQALVTEITGKDTLPAFSQNVVDDEELSLYIKKLYNMVTEQAENFEKEEMLLMLGSALLDKYCGMCKTETEQSSKINEIYSFMDAHYAEKIFLNMLCDFGKIGKSTLLREFTRVKGVTPYRYLQSVRIEKAKELLKNSVPPVDAAMQTGFSDQSHFTRFFHMYIGVSPAEYAKIFKNSKE